MNPEHPGVPAAPSLDPATPKRSHYREYIVIILFALFLVYLVWLRTDDYPWYEFAPGSGRTYILGLEVNFFRLLVVLPGIIYTFFAYWKLLKYYKRTTIGLLVWSVAFFFIPLVSPTIFLVYIYLRKQFAAPPIKVAGSYTYTPAANKLLREAAPKTAMRGITVLIIASVIIFFVSIFFYGA